VPFLRALETRQAMVQFAAENFVQGILGNRPPTLVNPEVLDRNER